MKIDGCNIAGIKTKRVTRRAPDNAAVGHAERSHTCTSDRGLTHNTPRRLNYLSSARYGFLEVNEVIHIHEGGGVFG